MRGLGDSYHQSAPARATFTVFNIFDGVDSLPWPWTRTAEAGSGQSEATISGTVQHYCMLLRRVSGFYCQTASHHSGVGLTVNRTVNTDAPYYGLPPAIFAAT